MDPCLNLGAKTSSHPCDTAFITIESHFQSRVTRKPNPCRSHSKTLYGHIVPNFLLGNFLLLHKMIVCGSV